MARTTSNNIETLKPWEIFVFGSNTAGRHGKGAEKQAFDRFGAEQGVGKGLTGRCYALPTLDENFQKLSRGSWVLVSASIGARYYANT